MLLRRDCHRVQRVKVQATDSHWRLSLRWWLIDGGYTPAAGRCVELCAWRSPADLAPFPVQLSSGTNRPPKGGRQEPSTHPQATALTHWYSSPVKCLDAHVMVHAAVGDGQSFLHVGGTLLLVTTELLSHVCFTPLVHF
jgi:hypothetical protein